MPDANNFLFKTFFHILLGGASPAGALSASMEMMDGTKKSLKKLLIFFHFFGEGWLSVPPRGGLSRLTTKAVTQSL